MMRGVLAITLPGFLPGAIFMALANRRASAEIARAWIPFAVVVVLTLGT